MKVIALNASPRRDWNTATLLKKALEGAESNGAETDFIQLNDLSYKGCQSCFGCKTKGSHNYGKCVVRDDLSDVLERIEESHAIILGSPIYLGEVPGMMRNLMERLLFPRLEYTKSPLLKRVKIKSGHIYTMNVNDERMRQWLLERLNGYESMYGRILGPAESLFVTDTLQWEDYSKYVTDGLDEVHKKMVRREKFPKDLELVYELGKRLCLQP